MTPKTPAVEKMSYEQAFAELERMILALENDQPALEESLALFERGQALVKRCAGLLDEAELRVRRLSDGDLDLLAEVGEG
ncbi:MAG: exodeoxyribonuclease VII small subunit [Chloroflexota bacterium]|jgi:exodeoxyribonuclease VII small subunit